MALNEKIKNWQNQLLDLSARNKLINCPKKGSDTRASRTSIEFKKPSFNELWEIFGDLRRCLNIRVPSRKKLNAETDKDDDTIYNEALNDGVITNQSRRDTIITIKTLKSKSKSFLDEKGFNTLFLAFGFLNWNNNESSNCFMRSPLCLVPVTITQADIFSPLKISRIDEERIGNKTLALKLLRSFSITLPEYSDADEFDFIQYLKQIKEASHGIGGDVEYSVELATFSFSKINMYQDLVNNREMIINNDIIKVIAGEKVELQNSYSDDSEYDYDNVDPKLIYNILDADSSQQDAIALANKGTSFILQGPPGTGKSQTITNIIGELLVANKKVLFVSEKMAALDVVHKRLRDSGLGEFCLTLHSHNANRTEILNQLNTSLLLAEKNAEIIEKANEDLATLRKLRDKLNKYQGKLHEPIEPLNLSIYQVISRYSKLEKIPHVNFLYNNADRVSYEEFTKQMAIISKISNFVKEYGWQDNNPWKGCILQELTLTFRSSFTECTRKLIELIESILVFQNSLNKILECDYKIKKDDIKDIDDFLKMVIDPEEVSISWISKDIESINTLYHNWSEKANSVNKYFKPTVYKYDTDSFLDKLRNKFRSIFRIFKSEYKIILAEFTSHLLNNKKKLRYKDAIIKASEISETRIAKTELINQLNRMTGKTDNEELINNDQIKSKIKKAQIIYTFANNHKIPTPIIQELIDMKPGLLNEIERLQNVIADWLSLYDPQIQCFSAIFKDADLIKKMNFDVLLEMINKCHNKYQLLDNYIVFRSYVAEATNVHIDGYVNLAIESKIKSEMICDAFRKCFYMSWLDKAIQKHDEIKSFNRLTHENNIEKFRYLDKRHLTIARNVIRAILIKRLPNPTAQTSVYDEIGLLKKEISKKRKQKPARKILEMIPNLLPNLKPCFMMSPLSVSALLQNDFRFDCVIFDEASQIKTEDAIGAIYRTKQVIITGDSKQLPPTTFFDAMYNDDTESDDDENDDTGAYESLLDEALQLPSKTLLWHYRSKHEHLIAFSNAKIYNGRLITFPSATDAADDLGVQYVHVKGGTYERGKKNGNGNREEAIKIAEMVFQHFENTPRRSLGIIAFSQSQQQIITDAIESKRAENPQFEHFFKEDLQEAFFIKNLETVQGDERDTIFFSIGYAPDVSGKFRMNFGPLSIEGGERRLNVAITRARYNLKLVGSILPTDIDADHIKHEGPKLLRSYIDFAINGPSVIIREAKASDAIITESPFEESVCEYLLNCGYDVKTQVGCLGYRIDLAIKHPEHKGCFAIGIECDGATYHSARSARERDRLRQSILEANGWTIYRIWSTDWIKDVGNEKKRLRDAVNEAIKNHKVEAEKPQEREKTTSSNSLIKGIKNAGILTDVRINSKNVNVGIVDQIKSDEYLKTTNKESKEKVIISKYAGHLPDKIPMTDYMITLCSVLECSYGISKSGLLKTTASAYGWKKVGSTINARITAALMELVRRGLVIIKDDTVELIDKEGWRNKLYKNKI